MRRGAKREFISRTYNRLLRLVLGVRFSDAQCGFKALRADAARRLLPRIQDQAWFFDTELLVLAQRAGMRLHEVAVDWADDPDSRVDIVSTALEDLRGVARLRVATPVARFLVIGVLSTLAYVALASGSAGSLGLARLGQHAGPGDLRQIAEHPTRRRTGHAIFGACAGAPGWPVSTRPGPWPRPAPGARHGALDPLHDLAAHPSPGGWRRRCWWGPARPPPRPAGRYVALRTWVFAVRARPGQALRALRPALTRCVSEHRRSRPHVAPGCHAPGRAAATLRVRRREQNTAMPASLAGLIYGTVRSRWPRLLTAEERPHRDLFQDRRLGRDPDDPLLDRPLLRGIHRGGGSRNTRRSRSAEFS